MILTTLPDLPPRPATAANATFRQRFYERWGRENAVVCGRARRAEYATLAQTLSIKMAFGGREHYFVGARERVVDDDGYLVLDEGSEYGSLLEAGPRPAWSFALFFRPGMQHEVAGDRHRTLGQLLDDPLPRRRPVSFHPLHRPHGDAVSRRLLALARAVDGGETDEAWLEEQCTAVLDALLGAEPRSEAMPRAAQRAELKRRLHEAADFMHARYTAPLALDDMARAACLSRYHFVRGFGREFGLSPCAWLARKRAAAARRLLATGERDREQIALRCGFGSRFALARALAASQGSPSQ